jgi:hypothetical protein
MRRDLTVGREYEILRQGKVIGIVNVLAEDCVEIYDPVTRNLIKRTTIERATNAAIDKGDTFRRIMK